MQNQHNDIQKTSHADVTAVILAGGRSTRMGRDKATLEVSGQTLFERIRKLLSELFSQVIIAGDRPDLASADIPCFTDCYPGSALGGIHTGLVAATTDWIFVAPCDMPFPDRRLIVKLLDQRTGVDAVVPRWQDGYEPVFALYHKRCLPQIETMLSRNQYRIYDFYQRIAIRYLNPPELPRGW